MITQELLKQAVLYHQDGYLIWKHHKISTYIGKRCGYFRYHQEGNRRKMCINYKSYYESRLIFLYHHGYLPDIVDHIDRNTENNKIENLRAATHSQNQYNKAVQKNSSSKYLGVYFHKSDKKWMVRIKVDKKCIYVGSYKDEHIAAAEYNKAAIIHHGQFANLNIIQYEFTDEDKKKYLVDNFEH